MREFIEFYREESTRIHGPKYAESEQNSVEAILREAKLFVLFTFLQETIFSVRMASFASTEEKREMLMVSSLW